MLGQDGEVREIAGDQYSGNWRRDQKHGHGKYVWADGDVYEGQWEKDMRAGEGICTYSNGRHAAHISPLHHLWSVFSLSLCAACRPPRSQDVHGEARNLLILDGEISLDFSAEDSFILSENIFTPSSDECKKIPRFATKITLGCEPMKPTFRGLT
jgi:hypothetical protein